MIEKSQPGRAVVFAASAGGIGALITVLSGLPADLPATVLIVQHLERHRPSRLVEILDRKAKMPVLQAKTGQSLEESTVYLAPPNFHLMITPSGAVLLNQGALVNYVRPAADVTFASVATHFGPRTIGVVLSGSGHDGGNGAILIRSAGGLVIAQDEATAAHFSMPQTIIESGQADFVLPVERISQKIVELVSKL